MLRLPASELISIETIHSAFKITRKADEQYVPPGRLRQFDLIVFDEGSQIENHVWQQIKTACAELSNGPFIVFVADFQQLQPISGDHRLKADLERTVASGGLEHIELLHHEAARSNDPQLLEFLTHVRAHQPSRERLTAFFANRILPKDIPTAVEKTWLWEQRSGRTFTFLTVTNKAAHDINMQRLKVEFPSAHAGLESRGVPGDEKAGAQLLVFAEGMRVRLTRNIDKGRGFVNGALGVITTVLSRGVFVMRAITGMMILVHPVCVDGKTFMPVTYAYAMTIRRAQGSTLDTIGLRFDRKRADRGYGYVGASRVRKATDVCLVGSIRRTDWRPVGTDPDGEQEYPGPMSDSSDDEQPESESERPDESSDRDRSSDDGGDADDGSDVDSRSGEEDEDGGAFAGFDIGVESCDVVVGGGAEFFIDDAAGLDQ